MKTLKEICLHAGTLTKKKRIVIASADDELVLKAVSDFIYPDLLLPVLIGDKVKIREVMEKYRIRFKVAEEIHHVRSVEEAAKLSVEMARKGQADILMKGLLPTKTFLKEILNRQTGITANEILSHIGIFESPFYKKLIGLTDAAINISPDVRVKKEIVRNAVNVFKTLGVLTPKVALLAAIERINPKMQATIDAAELIELNRKEHFADCILEGPVALDVAVSADAAEHKGIKSSIAGSVDILVVPDIGVGNVLYKSLTYLGGAKAAGILIGSSVPVVLTSRSDSEESKQYSIALAANLNINQIL